MECPKCHKQIQDNSKYCRYCGSKIPDKNEVSLYKNPAFPYAGISILILLVLLCIGYMLYPKPVSYVIEGTYSDEQKTLELLKDGTASFTDIDGIFPAADNRRYSLRLCIPYHIQVFKTTGYDKY